MSAAFFLGAAAYGFAQSPPPLPALAPLPNMPALPVAAEVQKVAAPPAPAAPETSSGAIPPLADLPSPPPAAAGKEETQSAKNEASAAQEVKDPSAKDGSKSEVVTANTNHGDKDAAGAPSLPALPSPPASTAPAPFPPLALPVPGQVTGGKATLLPGVNVAAEAPKPKSWESKLAPSYTPLETKFHYRRQLLPNTIYRRSYDEQNQHLPQAVTRQDYEGLLFYSAASNDVESVRALLNAGTNMNARDSEGQTPLRVAHAMGADAAAQLLLARGAR